MRSIIIRLLRVGLQTAHPCQTLFILLGLFLTVSVGSANAVTEYTIPTASGSPFGVAVGPDGNLWFVEGKGNKVGKMTTGGAITEYNIPTPNSEPQMIVTGSDGNLWFVEGGANKIARITTSGVITEYANTAGGWPQSLVLGPDGKLWFTDQGTMGGGASVNAQPVNGSIGSLDPATGAITKYPLLSAGTQADWITVGPDANLWFTQSGASNKIARITPTGPGSTPTITEVATLSTDAGFITTGPDGNLWFTEPTANKIARMTTAGAVTEFAVPSPNSGPMGITLGSDGALWFTETGIQNTTTWTWTGTGRIGRITTSGAITEFAIPTATDSAPAAITAGPDGALWFSEAQSNKIGRLLPAGATTPSLLGPWQGTAYDGRYWTANLVFNTDNTYSRTIAATNGTGSDTETGTVAYNGTSITVTVGTTSCTGRINCQTVGSTKTVTTIMTGSTMQNYGSGFSTVFFKVQPAAQTVGANNYTLSITNSGSGSGTVTSADGSINCGSTCSASFNGGAGVTLTATPTSGSAFAGWGGACTGTGICTVTMNAAQNVTASFAPAPFTVATTGITAGIITAPVATVTATIAVKAADVGKTGSVFVTAMVPASFLAAQHATTRSAFLAKALSSAADPLVLAQLTSSGWQAVTDGKLIPYVTGVLGDQLAALTLLNNTSTTNLKGSQFCVGYGTSAQEMTSAGRMQLIATIPDPNAAKQNTGSCNVALPISDDRVFAYAVSNYASLFAGTATAGQYQQYDYRYYPTYQNYLAVDNLGAVWVMGPVFTPPNKPVRVGPVESFRGAITTWEGAQ